MDRDDVFEDALSLFGTLKVSYGGPNSTFTFKYGKDETITVQLPKVDARDSKLQAEYVWPASLLLSKEIFDNVWFLLTFDVSK